MLARKAAAAPPTVYVTAADHQRLSALIGSSAALPRTAALLADELDRAIVVAPGEGPRGFVRLGSRVRYVDGAAGEARTVQLVLPAEADIDAGRVSVFTPVGAALLGLTAGQTFALGTDGRVRVLAILEVLDDDA